MGAALARFACDSHLTCFKAPFKFLKLRGESPPGVTNRGLGAAALLAESFDPGGESFSRLRMLSLPTVIAIRLSNRNYDNRDL